MGRHPASTGGAGTRPQNHPAAHARSPPRPTSHPPPKKKQRAQKRRPTRYTPYFGGVRFNTDALPVQRAAWAAAGDFKLTALGNSTRNIQGSHVCSYACLVS
jgi:hypothetical protein